MSRASKRGFTLVELLIVIVIIAILATITVVAYNGIQRRATNTAIVAAVTNAVKQLRVYKADRGTYPVFDAERCLSRDNVCARYNGSLVTWGNTDFVTAMAQYTTLPQTWPGSGRDGMYYGANYMYKTVDTFNGAPSPALVTFWLDGSDQDCRVVGGTVSVADTNSDNDYSEAKNNNPTTNGGRQTRCYLMFVD